MFAQCFESLHGGTVLSRHHAMRHIAHLPLQEAFKEALLHAGGVNC